MAVNSLYTSKAHEYNFELVLLTISRYLEKYIDKTNSKSQYFVFENKDLNKIYNTINRTSTFNPVIINFRNEITKEFQKFALHARSSKEIRKILLKNEIKNEKKNVIIKNINKFICAIKSLLYFSEKFNFANENARKELLKSKIKLSTLKYELKCTQTKDLYVDKDDFYNLCANLTSKFDIPL